MSNSKRLTDKQVQITVPRYARLAVAAMFFVQGSVFANWVARIPTIQNKLGLSNGALGVALLGMSIGAVVFMPITGGVIARVGSRPITKIAAIAYCMALPLQALAPNLVLLTVALAVFGAFNGAMLVAMNTQGFAVEQRYHRPIMSSFHGILSSGCMVGAISGGVMASLGVTPVVHFIFTALFLGMVVVFASHWLLPSSFDSATQKPMFVLPTRSLIFLGVVAFCVLLGEGAMADWSAIYLQKVLKTEPGIAAAGYAVFSLAMAVCRLTGDRLIQYLGSVWMIRLGGIIAAVGLGISLVTAQPIVAIIGFACVGVGFSSIVPITFSAAGHTPGMTPSLAIAAVTTAGYFGFLLGPPLIGFTADLLTLRAALGIVVILSVIIAVLAPKVSSPNSKRVFINKK
ncbi:MFS transporter [Nostoc sp. CHAB 5784]|uniref:MFS transporter n=1 Tax=Nostoc mirabile TaxID=2907820 RepID=UPI001E517B65|nr:MFS transporter [Nostoc mirabile]MCC5670318.1 MFS transporter [Nostoc mirabile CHAB5784]